MCSGIERVRRHDDSERFLGIWLDDDLRGATDTASGDHEFGHGGT
jgi:hypothetical protein